MNKVSLSSINFSILSPLNDLQRTSILSAQQDALIYGKRHYSWQDLYQRCCAFASQLQQLNISNQDTVSTLLPNVPALFEAHFAVPMVGAILNPLATHLDAQALALQLKQSKSKVLLVDPEFSDVAKEALALLHEDIFVIDVDDEYYELCFKAPIGNIEYEDWLAEGNIEFEWSLPQNEYQPIYANNQNSLNPLLYPHREAYIQAIKYFIYNEIKTHSGIISSLNAEQNWPLIWSMAIHGGTYICLRNVDAEVIWATLQRHQIHYLQTNSATLTMLVNSKSIHKSPLLAPVMVLSATTEIAPTAQQHLAHYGLHLHHSVAV